MFAYMDDQLAPADTVYAYMTLVYSSLYRGTALLAVEDTKKKEFKGAGGRHKMQIIYSVLCTSQVKNE